MARGTTSNSESGIWIKMTIITLYFILSMLSFAFIVFAKSDVIAANCLVVAALFFAFGLSLVNANVNSYQDRKRQLLIARLIAKDRDTNGR